jgi:hypothetical protein
MPSLLLTEDRLLTFFDLNVGLPLGYRFPQDILADLLNPFPNPKPAALAWQLGL